MQSEGAQRRYGLALALTALGVVYGDIGTSPLYALRECFSGSHGIAATRSNVLGVLSLVTWSLTVLISVKYLTFVMRADNKGEGGILALLALIGRDPKNVAQRRTTYLVLLGVFGAALLYGDGMITPVITVLGAVEGLKVATPVFEPWLVPLAIVILVGLFSVQHTGTSRVGGIFGPVMLIWFVTISVLGIRGILMNPGVLWAMNPWHGLKFFIENNGTAFVVLGAVFLVVTGGEALYADMGHFGREPIRKAWFTLVFPSLLLNYFGQGALLLREPATAVNPFYELAPSWAIYPLVALATLAAAIASQALISGAFSLTMQAIQLGYSPRMTIDHTSSAERGQIYLPQVNWALLIACIGLVLGFRSSSNLAAAYGIAVTLTMIITTLLFYFACQQLWGWSKAKARLVCLPFLLIELAFFGANLLKVTHGGWFPLLVGAMLFTLMSTWKTGREILRQKLQRATLPLEIFLNDVRASAPLLVKGTAVFMAGNPKGAPLALLHNFKHNKVLHERSILLTLVTEEVPHVDEKNRLTVEKMEGGFFRVIGHLGFMEEPNVPRLLERCRDAGLEVNLAETTFFLSRETIIPTASPGMAIWRERIFAVMARNAQSATAFFKLPANRVVELGMQVEF